MKEKRIYLFILLGMAVSLLGIAGASYSLYKSSPKGTTMGSIANWSFSVNGKPTTFLINMGTNAKNTQNGMIAPGSYGEFELNLDANGTDSDVFYKINFQNLKGKPNNLNFYLDNKYTSKIDLNSDILKGKIDHGENMNKKIIIYWKWDNSNENENIVQGSVISFDIIIVGSQIA